jgi:hypothetical protein
MTLISMLGVMTIAVSFGSLSAFAAPEQQISGTVVELQRDAVVVRRGAKRLEFSYVPAVWEGVRVGDRVTVWYSLEPSRVEREPRRQEPGRSGEEPKDIVDDRLFYDASNGGDATGMIAGPSGT